jgi:hypothetical protein
MKWIYPQRILLAYIVKNGKKCEQYLTPYLLTVNGTLPE